MSVDRTVRIVSWLGAALLAAPLAVGAASAGKLPAAAFPQTPAPKLPAETIVKARYEATTEKTALKQGAVSAGGMTWNCAGSRCTATQPAGTAADACRALAREVGAIASFVFGTKTFTAAELAQCRTAAGATAKKKKAQTTSTAVAAQIDPDKAKHLQPPVSPPGGIQQKIQPGTIAPEPADLRVASMTLLGNRKVSITVLANASANGRNATLELYDAQSNRKLWSGGVTIAPIFGKYGAIAVADYRVPAQRRQKLKARVTPLDENPANNELVMTLGPAGAPMYVDDGVVNVQAPNRIEPIAVVRKGPNWVELRFDTVVAGEAAEMWVYPNGVRNAECISGSGSSSTARRHFTAFSGRTTWHFLCRAEPQTASGTVIASLSYYRRVVSTQAVPWSVTPPSAGDSGPPVRSDLTIVNGRMEFIDEKPGRIWVRIRNNGPERVQRIFSVTWSAFTPEQSNFEGKARQLFNLASGEEKELNFDLRGRRTTRGRPVTWTCHATGPYTSFTIVVDSDFDIFETNEDNNLFHVPATHPMFGNCTIREAAG